MKHEIFLNSNNGVPSIDGNGVSLVCQEDSQDTRFFLSIGLTEWENDAYVFLPACVYNGNRFEKSYKDW